MIVTVPATASAAATATTASTRARAVIGRERSPPSCRYISESHAELPRAAAAGAGRDRRGGRRAGARASRRRPSRRSSSTCASPTSGPRATIPGAIHVPRGNLESRIERAAPDRARPIVVYCAAGNRSVFAAKTLEELGYENVVSLAGGYTDWKRNGYPTQLPRTLDAEKRSRYSRHLLIPEVGEEGQLKLLESRVLLIGAGGLGSPAGLYLAAAGVGRLGIVDDDRVDASNLQRQIAHSTETLGDWKVDSATPHARGAEPRRRGRDVQGAAHVRERRPHPRRRLGRDRRRRRQLPDALPHQRRLRLPRHPRRARLDLPLRGPGHRLQAARGPVLPLPLPAAAAARARTELRRGRRARRAAGHRRLAAGERGAEALPRHRRARSPAGCCSSTRSRPSSARSRSAATRTARSAASTPRSPSTSTTSSSAQGGRSTHDDDPHPTDASHRDRRRARRCPPPAAPCASCSTT